ncbi:MAG TPA: MBL fold metallo-hydrolase [Solirubrobacteraceae bacterium]|nr:MBL fold metallo-hydrolase [Solirubrobacteraceae bacterium]
MDTPLPGLHASEPQSLPFAPQLLVRSFVLERPAGDLLLYGTEAEPAIAGAKARYLNHWHEAMFAADLDGTPTHVHELDREQSENRTAIAGTFADRTTLDGDFEVIPTPGHTPGATAFLWDSGEHRMLFTGDSLFLDEGEWVIALDVRGADRDAYVASLELIRGLDFDVLVPWAATAGQPPHAMTDAADVGRRIDAILDRVRRGDDR